MVNFWKTDTGTGLGFLTGSRSDLYLENIIIDNEKCEQIKNGRNKSRRVNHMKITWWTHNCLVIIAQYIVFLLSALSYKYIRIKNSIIFQEHEPPAQGFRHIWKKHLQLFHQNRKIKNFKQRWALSSFSMFYIINRYM